MGEGALSRLAKGWAARTPEATAIVDERGEMTFADLARSAAEWSAAMAGAGIGAGDRVAMLAPPSREALVSLLAANHLGASWSGIDPRLKRDELDARIADLRPKLVVTFADLGGRRYGDEISAICEHQAEPPRLVALDDTQGGGETLRRFLAVAGDTAASATRNGSDGAHIIIYTSGSSGVPKGAEIRDQAVVDFARMQNEIWPVTPLRTLNFLPIGHAGSIIDLTIPTLAAGGCVVFQRKFDPLGSLELVAAQRVTFWASVPSTFIMQAALPEFKTTDLRHVQLIAIEGAAIPKDLAATLLPIAPIATNYGMSETCSAITASAPTRVLDELVESVGRPLRDVEIRIDGPRDGVGEILVRSSRTLVGYLGKPAETRAAFDADGFFRTGDLGELLPDGRLRLTGRKREMFKSGGYNVYPAEIERVIEEHPAVDIAAIVPVDDPVWGEVGVAFLKIAAAQPETSLAQVERLCRDRLADYKRPKRFVLLEALPLLPVGKVDRVALRALAAGAA